MKSSKSLLREYLKLVLNESQGEITPDDMTGNSNPLEWITAAWLNPTAFAQTDDPFAAILKITVDKLGNPLGEGTSRLVFEKGDSVVKIARNEKGVEQNKLEAIAGQDALVANILAKVKDHDHDFIWLVSERVQPLKGVKEFETATGMLWNDLRNLLGGKTLHDLDVTAPTTKQSDQSQEQSTKVSGSCLYGKGFEEGLREFLVRYDDLLPGDIAKYDSWGKNSDGCIVLLDYGITKKKFKELYSK